MPNNVLEHFTPDKLFDPASLRNADRQRLTMGLDAMGIRRISVQRRFDRQTIKKVGDEWLITCSNAKY
jgi:hypothetical protein